MKYPEWLDVELWKEYKQHRKECKRPLTPLAESRAIAKLLRISIESNCSHQEIVIQSIENCWLGLFHLHRPKQEISNGCSATSEARRLAAEGYRTGFEDEENNQPAFPQNVVNLR